MTQIRIPLPPLPRGGTLLLDILVTNGIKSIADMSPLNVKVGQTINRALAGCVDFAGNSVPTPPDSAWVKLAGNGFATLKVINGVLQVTGTAITPVVSPTQPVSQVEADIS